MVAYEPQVRPTEANAPDYRSVVVEVVEGARGTHRFWLPGVSNLAVRDALSGTLDVTEMLALAEEDVRFVLNVMVHEVKQPFMGFNMHCTVVMSYEVVDEASGKTLLNETITGRGVGRISEHISSASRRVAGIESAVRDNFAQLIPKVRAASKALQ